MKAERLNGRLVVLGLWILAAGCSLSSQGTRPHEETMPRRDIDAVLRTHENELMAIPGVVGVYVGFMDDDKTPCLKVMAVEKTRDLKRQVPKSLEGYPVVIEETGVIRPLRNPNSGH